MRAFIVRPFGEKQAASGLGIDFERVERELIAPALEALGIEGRTTQEIAHQGNIRQDMFELLLTADVVVADITIHNANVFYELGLRHGFRDRITFLIRGTGSDDGGDTDRPPFDLQTDRYLAYDVADPGASLDRLVKGLRDSIRHAAADSPVFQMLPLITPQDPTLFLTLPEDFAECVQLRTAERRVADLALMSLELERFQPSWGRIGQQILGEALFGLKAYGPAAEAWERVRAFASRDTTANLRLATCYQKVDQLDRSALALDRLGDDVALTKNARAEYASLSASNAKTRWMQGWASLDDADAQKAALASPHLAEAAEQYTLAFQTDLNHFYSGLNALAMLQVQRQLIAHLPEHWEDMHASPEAAAAERAALAERVRTIEGALALSLTTAEAAEAAKPANERDPWVAISAADFACLTRSDRPGHVKHRYQAALAQPTGQMRDSILRQLDIYVHLGLFGEAAVQAAALVRSLEGEPEIERGVLVFTGHRADAPGRPEPRFPNTEAAIDRARARIHEAVEERRAASQLSLVGLAGGASGGDLLFHEVCEELGIETWLLLALPRDQYIVASVQDGGAAWVERFNALYKARDAEGRILVMQEQKDLPAWLGDAEGYDVWSRNNLWTLSHAFQGGAADTALIALWNNREGDGPGGTKDMVALAKAHGVLVRHLDATELAALG